MPNQRVQVGGLQGAALRPTATPVDTFTQTDAGRKLAGLAQGLAQFSPAAANLGATIADRYIGAEKQKGRTQALLDVNEVGQSLSSWNDAIKKGEVHASRSPWFRAAYEEESGHQAAGQWQADFLVKHGAELQGETDPKVFEQKAHEHMREWLATRAGENPGEFFQAGFSNSAGQLLDGMRQNFAQQAGANVIKAAAQTFHGSIMGDVVRMRGEGKSESEIATAIGERLTTQIRAGMNGSIANQIAALAVVNAARRLNDPLLAQHILDNVTGGTPGSKLSMIGGVAEQIEQAENEIAEQTDRSWAREENAKQRRKETEFQGIEQRLVAGMEATANNPMAFTGFGALRKEAAKLGAEYVDRLYKIRDVYTHRVQEDDPLVASTAFAAVDGLDPDHPGQYLTKEQASRLLFRRQITIPTYNQLVAKIDDREQGGGGGASRGILTNRWLTVLRDNVKGRLAADIGESNPIYKLLSRQAELDAIRRFQEWVAGGGNANDDVAALQFVTDAAEAVYAVHAGNTSNLRQIQRDHPVVLNGPQRPDWTKVRVLGGAQANMIKKELEEVAQHKRNGLSQQSFYILQTYGVSETDAQQFVDTQLTLR